MLKTKMYTDSELHLENKKLGIYGRGYHDKEGMCFKLKAGFQFKKYDSKKIFSYYPYIQNLLENDILPAAQTMGDDSLLCVTRDIICYAITDSPTNSNLDELSIAASILTGKLTKGENVWLNESGMSIKNLNLTIPDISPIDINNQRYDMASEIIFDMLIKGKNELIKMLSYGYHINIKLGNQNEDLFTTPRQIDRGGMPRLGFECAEADGFDLIVPGVDKYTASDKIKKGVFHYKDSKKVRPSNIHSGVPMGSIRSGQSSNNISRPKFDTLILMQYNPFIVCGVASYSKIARHIRIKDGGTILGKVPIDDFRYIISPSEYFDPCNITPEQSRHIDEFVILQRGGLMQNLLDLPLKIEDTTISKNNIW